MLQVCQTMTQPSGVKKHFPALWMFLKMLTSTTSSATCVILLSLCPPVIYIIYMCLHDSRLALTNLRLKPPSLMRTDVISAFAKTCLIVYCLLCLKDAAASYDFNDNDPDPFPRYDSTNENKWVSATFWFWPFFFMKPFCCLGLVITGYTPV